MKDVYVKAVSSERFYVLVEFKNFQFKSAPDLQISCFIDDDVGKSFQLSSSGGKQIKPVKWKHMTRFIDDKWTKCALAFRDTDIGKVPKLLDRQ